MKFSNISYFFFLSVSCCYCSYDLLFGITESESYHSLGAMALEEGLRENERDNLLRFYMQTRFDVRPDLALAATLKK